MSKGPHLQSEAYLRVVTGGSYRLLINQFGFRWEPPSDNFKNKIFIYDSDEKENVDPERDGRLKSLTWFENNVHDLLTCSLSDLTEEQVRLRLDYGLAMIARYDAPLRLKHNGVPVPSFDKLTENLKVHSLYEELKQTPVSGREEHYPCDCFASSDVPTFLTSDCMMYPVSPRSMFIACSQKLSDETKQFMKNVKERPLEAWLHIMCIQAHSFVMLPGTLPIDSHTKCVMKIAEEQFNSGSYGRLDRNLSRLEQLIFETQSTQERQGHFEI